MFLLPIVVVVGIVVVVRHGRISARSYRRLGFVVSAVQGVFVGLFVVGETFTDPGGLAAVGLVALWLVPLAVVSWLAWVRPDTAAPILVAAVGLVIAASVWYAVDTAGWRSFEDGHGPVRGIAAFAVALALAVYGLRRTRQAGILLLVLGIVPTLAGGLGRVQASLFVLTSSAVVTGVLYLLSAAAAKHQDETTGPPASARLAPHDEDRSQ